MNIMNLEKALNILGLTKNYTEEDLKKAYKNLMIKYHSDKWEGKTETEKKMAEEKAKEINAAKDFLDKYKSNRTSRTNNSNNSYQNHTAYNYIVFVQAKASFIQEIINYDNELINLVFSQEVILLNKIKVLKTLNNKYKNKISNSKNIVDLNHNIIEFKASIWKELEHFTEVYCKKYNINTDTSKLEKYSLKKLYEQLEKLRRKQNNNNSILDIIEEEYKLYAGYIVIKDKIKEIKKEILKEYKEGIYTEEEAKKRFETKVLLEFQEYYRRIEIINHFKSLGYKDRTIQAIISIMEENITADKATFKTYEKQLTNFIADKETRKTPGRPTKIFNTKEKTGYNHNYKITKKDYIIKDKYCIKHSPSEEPKYKIKKNR